MNKLDFFEKVKVLSHDDEYQEVWNKVGTILGMSESDEKEWYYCVSINEITHIIPESSLASTGSFSCSSEFYDDDPESKITVVVDKDGNGSIKDE